MSTPSNALQKTLTRDTLRAIAGDRYFARGEDYFRRGYVHDLVVDGDGLTARVSGTVDYYVELWAEDDELQASCTCPLGVDDLFCKHCVAVGLTWLDHPSAARVQKRSRSAQKAVTMADVEYFLERQDKSTLMQWILDRANQDKSWKQQLLLKVAATRPQGIDLTTYQRALRNAIAVQGYIEWNQVSDYTDGIQDVLSSVAELLDQHPQTVIELCEYAIPMIETAMNAVDDSSGDLGTILEDFLTLHYDACVLGQPDPIPLAEHLFQSEFESGFGSFPNAVTTYAAILGDEGLAHYRQLAETKWAEFPTLSSKDTGEWNYKRHKLQRMLENLVKVSGDGIEAIVAIKRRDLSTSRAYLDIAQLYLQDGQPDRALEWAESGLKAFVHPDSHLRDFVIEEYYRRGRPAEAMALVWQGFTQSISLPSYQKLKTQAELIDQWSPWRDKALAHIRQQLEPPPPPPETVPRAARRGRAAKPVSSVVAPPRTSSGWLQHDRSLLVEILLWEGEDDVAWQEAQAGGCSHKLWLKLAEQRQRSHPEDALPIYQKEIEPLIQQTNNTAYANAVSFLNRVHDLMLRLDRQAEFNALVAHLRQTYKAKRNFIALLNRQNW